MAFIPSFPPAFAAFKLVNPGFAVRIFVCEQFMGRVRLFTYLIAYDFFLSMLFAHGKVHTARKQLITARELFTSKCIWKFWAYFFEDLV